MLLCSAVLHQVETQIADFRKDLVKKLYTLPSTLGEQKKTIKLVADNAQHKGID